MIVLLLEEMVMALGQESIAGYLWRMMRMRLGNSEDLMVQMLGHHLYQNVLPSCRVEDVRLTDGRGGGSYCHDHESPIKKESDDFHKMILNDGCIMTPSYTIQTHDINISVTKIQKIIFFFFLS